MILSNTDIREELNEGNLVVEPLDQDQIQPASIDLTLADDFVVYGGKGYKATLHPSDEDMIRKVGTEYSGVSSMTVKPDQFVLASTQEEVALPNNVVGTVEGVSSMGRLGPIPHTAGHVDPGFGSSGAKDITLEIKNLNPHPVELEPGMRFCQIVLKYTNSPASPGYDEKEGAKYDDQDGATPSRYHEEISSEDAADK